MRKKFLIFCDTWLFEPLTCLFEDRGRPEKVLFSVRVEFELEFEELKSCVMAMVEVSAYLAEAKEMASASTGYVGYGGIACRSQEDQ